ncbi:MAG: hypothetical protein ACOYM2_20440, partial [Rectinemataceae bacterium]
MSLTVNALSEALDSIRAEDRAGLLEDFAESASPEEIWEAVGVLHERAFAESASPYLKVRALLQASYLCRYALPRKLPVLAGHIPFEVVELLRQTRFVDALTLTHRLCVEAGGLPSDALSSVLAAAYWGHGFQVLALQVQNCVRSIDGNRWMFRLGNSDDYCLRLRPELLAADRGTGLFPVLQESTPVRMDLS